MRASIFLFFLLICLSAVGQTIVHQYIADQKNQHQWLEEYSSFLSIPNVLGDSINIHRNAEFIRNLLEQNGVKSEL